MREASSGYPHPIYRLDVDGADITIIVQGRLLDLTLTDNRGFEADQLDLRLDDTDGRLDLPPRGAEIRLALGWSDTGLVPKGTYTVDEVEHSGAPDVVSVRARSADLRTGLTTQKERSWHDTTLGHIVSTIAAENDLQPAVGATLAGQPIKHIDQTNENDVNLLTRLATQFDAISTVKDGKLIFIPMAGCASASGTALPMIDIVREVGDQHRFAIADRDSYTGVKALFNDIDGAAKGEVIFGKDGTSAEHASKDAAISHSAENVKVLRHVYASKANALRASKAEWQRLQRGLASFSITLAHGRPELFPEIPANIAGFKRSIDGADWIITKATHTLGDGGLTTALELELKSLEG